MVDHVIVKFFNALKGPVQKLVDLALEKIDELWGQIRPAIDRAINLQVYVYVYVYVYVMAIDRAINLQARASAPTCTCTWCVYAQAHSSSSQRAHLCMRMVCACT